MEKRVDEIWKKTHKKKKPSDGDKIEFITSDRLEQYDCEYKNNKWTVIGYKSLDDNSDNHTNNDDEEEEPDGQISDEDTDHNSNDKGEEDEDDDDIEMDKDSYELEESETERVAKQRRKLTLDNLFHKFETVQLELKHMHSQDRISKAFMNKYDSIMERFKAYREKHPDKIRKPRKTSEYNVWIRDNYKEYLYLQKKLSEKYEFFTQKMYMGLVGALYAIKDKKPEDKKKAVREVVDAYVEKLKAARSDE